MVIGLQEKLKKIGDISLNNENEILTELLEYKKYGGESIVDATNISLNRNPLGLKYLSEKTGLNIIMGSGYYLDPTHPKDMNNRTINEIKNEMGYSGNMIRDKIIMGMKLGMEMEIK